MQRDHISLLCVTGRICQIKSMAKYRPTLTTALDRQLLTRGTWHFAFLTTGGKSAVNQSQTCIN